MKAYIYDETTGEYLFEQERQSSPLEVGVFFGIQNSTGKAPPECEEKEVQVWNGCEWELKADYRNVKVWKTIDATQSHICEIGKSLGTEYTDTEPDVDFPKWDGTKWIEDVVEKQKYFKKNFKEKAEAWLVPRRKNGFQFGDYKVSGDAEAQANFGGSMTLIQMGVTGPFLCRDTENVDHMLDVSQVKVLVLAMAQFIQGCYQACWAAKASIDEATTVSECELAIELLNNY